MRERGSRDYPAPGLAYYPPEIIYKVYINMFKWCKKISIHEYHDILFPLSIGQITNNYVLGFFLCLLLITMSLWGPAPHF